MLQSKLNKTLTILAASWIEWEGEFIWDGELLEARRPPWLSSCFKLSSCMLGLNSCTKSGWKEPPTTMPPLLRPPSASSVNTWIKKQHYSPYHSTCSTKNATFEELLFFTAGQGTWKSNEHYSQSNGLILKSLDLHKNKYYEREALKTKAVLSENWLRVIH